MAGNAWHHIAFVRKSGTLYLFINGVFSGSGSANVTVNAPSAGWAMTLGRWTGASEGSLFLNGYLDEFRFTKGVGRYTASFAPPAQAFDNALPVAADPEDAGHMPGDLYTLTNAAGHVTTFNSYDRAGRLREMTDPKGVVTAIAYTPRGWVEAVTVTPPGLSARTTTYSYDFAGQLTGVAMPDGSSLSYTYDAAHRLTRVTDAKGNYANYTLDNAGNRLSEDVKDSSGTLQRSIARSYDALNRVQQVTGAPN